SRATCLVISLCPSPLLPLLFSLLRSPPTSTLFPYTTLFRSTNEAHVAAGSGCADCLLHRFLRAYCLNGGMRTVAIGQFFDSSDRSEEHTSELQSRFDLVCRLLLEKKKQQ